MIPKTKLQHLVLELSNKLPKLDDKHLEWGKKQYFKKYAYKTKHLAVCYECAHRWKEETSLVTRVGGLICPNCGAELTEHPSKAWKHEENGFISIETTFHNIQVIRYAIVSQYISKGYPAQYLINEICQHWITGSGQHEIIGLTGNGVFGYYMTDFNRWKYGHDFELRNRNSDKYYINGAKVYPYKRYIRELFRNGFNHDTHGYNSVYFMYALLHYPKMETLLKAGYMSFVKEFSNQISKIEAYWPQIKMIMRKKIKVSDVDIWFDYIADLVRSGKDIHNPKYICVRNYKQLHQANIKREREKLRRKEMHARRARMAEDDKKYQKDKWKFIGLSFSSGDLEAHVLRNIYEFFDEGETLHHCVYYSSYYVNTESIILSASYKGKKVETVQVSIKDFNIMQSRGYKNKSSRYHKKIIALVENNMDLIKKASKKKRKEPDAKEKELQVA